MRVSMRSTPSPSATGVPRGLRRREGSVGTVSLSATTAAAALWCSRSAVAVPTPAGGVQTPPVAAAAFGVQTPAVTVSALDAVLWLLAVVFYGVGDYVTTVAATRRATATERNPLLRRLFATGAPPAASFAAVKLVAFGCFGAGYLLGEPSLARSAIPAVVALVGVVVTAQNVRVLRR
jgi:hypothetical protein